MKTVPEANTPVLLPVLWSEARSQLVHRALERAQDDLRRVQSGCAQEVQFLSRRFELLSQQTAVILDSVRQIVDCASGERMQSLLGSLQTLAPVVRAFVQGRLADADRVREMLRAEGAALKQLSALMHSQKAIVRETEVLRVLTRIEVAQLGADGLGFQYLADELDDFSQSLQKSVGELTGHTTERRSLIESGYHSLLDAMPRIRRQFHALEEAVDHGAAQAEISMAGLSEIPTRYQACVESIAGWTSGIVAAIQTQDITHQQIEHVCEAFPRMLARLSATAPTEGASASSLSLLRKDLRVQSFQLQNARSTISGWTSRIRSCLDAMMRVSAEDIEEFGAAVLSQEQVLAAQLSAVERFDQECQTGQLEVQRSLQGIQSLMALVREHLQRSTAVRDRLQLLMFNSIIEAGSLGSRADGIREISMSIRRLSARWNAITTESEKTLEDMLAIAAQPDSESGSESAIGSSGSQSGFVVEALHAIASCAGRETETVRVAVAPLRALGAEIAAAANRLEVSFAALDAAIELLAGAEAELGPAAEVSPDAADLERLFSENYTTETEREVLRAALGGKALPELSMSCAGNDVELF